MKINIKEYITQNKEKVQLAYGMILIVLIPLLIVANTNWVIESYNRNINVILQRQVLSTGRVIYDFLKSDLGNDTNIQKKIDEVFAKNQDLEEITVLVPDKNGFRVTASSKKENIGKTSSLLYYNLAWGVKDGEGLAGDSVTLSSTAEGPELLEGISKKDKIWLVTLPMSGSDGNTQALLSLKISYGMIDRLTKSSADNSILLLIITVVIVILFLSITIRLWDYALLYKKIKEVDQMKDEFISIASHELRTPLTAIKGYLSLIAEGTFGKIENKEMERGVNMAVASTKRLEALVEDLLNVSRIEQGRLDVNNKPVEIEPIIGEIMAQLKVQADAKHLLLEYSNPESKLPLVSADPERLKQVLVNLIGNSIKYTEKGSVKVTSVAKEGKVEIRIADTGIGMSAEEQKHLFEKFYRIQNDKTSKIIGTGLGLWITKQIVQLMKGKLTVESMKDVGTQVSVELNLA